MNIGVMGAGAVGCYYGALLARAGHKVTLVGRQVFVDRVAAHGLRLEAAGFDDVVSVTLLTRVVNSAHAGVDAATVDELQGRWWLTGGDTDFR